MFGGKRTENCSLIVKCDLYAGKIWGAEEPLSSICIVLWD